MRTIVYIDGFNLYYRMLKAAPAYKWLNLKDLSTNVLRAKHEVIQVNYYTARVGGSEDKDAPRRQQIYLDALQTVPEIRAHFGKFLPKKKWAKFATKPPRTKPETEFSEPYPRVAKVWKTEEKGSDVNLASHLVRDACKGAFEAAAVLSNDTDLIEPIRIVKEEMGLPIALLTPVGDPAIRLVEAATFVRHVKPFHLKRSQFPDKIPGTDLERPPTWAGQQKTEEEDEGEDAE